MDLTKYDSVKAAEQGAELELRDPVSNLKSKIFIRVLGHDSKDYQRVVSKQNQRRTSRVFQHGRFKPGNLTDQEFKQDAIEILAECTLSWRDETEEKPELLVVGGQRLECTKENAIRVYTELPWIKEQVEDFVTDRANFIKV